MVALAESDLYVQANSKIPLSLTLPHDRVGGDHDSLGVFQQRPRFWGDGSEDDKVRQLMDPAESARLFYAALVRVRNWTSIDPWVAAQAVQCSAFANGSNYRARMTAAALAIAGGPRYFTERERTP